LKLIHAINRGLSFPSLKTTRSGQAMGAFRGFASGHRWSSSVPHSHLCLQVAQLWKRDRAKLETFSTNVQRYSQNHAQKLHFGPPYVHIGCNVSGLFQYYLKGLMQRNFVAEFHRENASYTRKTAN